MVIKYRHHAHFKPRIASAAPRQLYHLELRRYESRRKVKAVSRQPGNPSQSIVYSGFGRTTSMDSTPVTRRGSILVPMQPILDSASKHQPPASSLGPSQARDDFTTPQLMAVSKLLDVAILCEGNALRAANILDVQEDHDPNGGGERADVLSVVTFATGTPRERDEVVPSDSIPANISVQGIEFSPGGTALLVWGEAYVAVAYLPRVPLPNGGKHSRSSYLQDASPARTNPGRESRADPDGSTRSGGAKSASRWHWTLIDMTSYAVDVMQQRIVRARWHPWCEGCVTLLTSSREDQSAWASASVMFQVPGKRQPEEVRSDSRLPLLTLLYPSGHSS